MCSRSIFGGHAYYRHVARDLFAESRRDQGEPGTGGARAVGRAFEIAFERLKAWRVMLAIGGEDEIDLGLSQLRDHHVAKHAMRAGMRRQVGVQQLDDFGHLCIAQIAGEINIVYFEPERLVNLACFKSHGWLLSGK